jgi:hypothetical protein
MKPWPRHPPPLCVADLVSSSLDVGSRDACLAHVMSLAGYAYWIIHFCATFFATKVILDMCISLSFHTRYIAKKI